MDSMDDLDLLVRQQFIPLLRRVNRRAEEEHPLAVKLLAEAVFARDKRVGLNVMAHGHVAAAYTIELEGSQVVGCLEGQEDLSLVLAGILDLKPIFSLSRGTLERIIADESRLLENPIAGLRAYLPEIFLSFAAD